MTRVEMRSVSGRFEASVAAPAAESRGGAAGTGLTVTAGSTGAMVVGTATGGTVVVARGNTRGGVRGAGRGATRTGSGAGGVKWMSVGGDTSGRSEKDGKLRTVFIASSAAAKSAAVVSNATPPLVQSGASLECDQGP